MILEWFSISSSIALIEKVDYIETFEKQITKAPIKLKEIMQFDIDKFY